jgi:hypothetical protein
MPLISHIIRMYKKGFNRETVDCEKFVVRKFIVDAIMKEFALTDKKSVEDAFDKCAARASSPVDVGEFLRSVTRQLKLVVKN